MKKLLLTGMAGISLMGIGQDQDPKESLKVFIPIYLFDSSDDQPMPEEFINFEDASLPRGKGVFIDGALLAITEGKWIYHNKPAFSTLDRIGDHRVVKTYYFVPEAIFKNFNIFSFIHCYSPAYGYSFSHNEKADMHARLGAKLADYTYAHLQSDSGRMDFFESKIFEGKSFGKVITLYFTPDYAEELLVNSNIDAQLYLKDKRDTFVSATLDTYYFLCKRSNGFMQFNRESLIDFLKSATKNEDEAQQIMDRIYPFMPKKEMICRDMEGKQFTTDIINILNTDYFKILEQSGDIEKLAKEKKRICKVMQRYNFNQFFSHALTQRAAYAKRLGLLSKEKFDHINSTLNPEFIFEGHFVDMNPVLEQKDIDDVPIFEEIQRKALAGCAKDQEMFQSYNKALERVLLSGQSLYCVYDAEKNAWEHDKSDATSVINLNESESLALNGFLQGHGLTFNSVISEKTVMYYIARLTYEHTLNKHNVPFDAQEHCFVTIVKEAELAKQGNVIEQIKENNVIEQIKENYVVPCKTALFEASLKKGGSTAFDVKEYLEQKIAANESDNAALCARKMLTLYNNAQT